MSALLEIGHVAAGEQPPARPARAPGAERDGHVGGAPVLARFEMLAHGAEIGRVAGLVPGPRDGLVDERRLDVVDGAPAPAHPPDDAREHREALLAVVAVMGRGPGVDHREGVQASPRPCRRR